MKSRPRRPRIVAVTLLLLLAPAAAALAACRSAAPIQPGPAAPASAATSIAAASHADADSARPAEAAATAAVAAPPAKGYAEADVRFMQGMIHHHAQALQMTALVPSRTRRDDMRLLAKRIEVSQRDEIALMSRWLQDRHEHAPSAEMLRMMTQGGADSAHAGMHHDMAHAMGHDSTGHQMPAGGETAMMHMMNMPGMLTAEQMGQLAAATGAQFDRLFLEDMIRHHEGALTMVRQLFATPGAGQEGELFRLASDVEADQRAEIARMRAMLAAMDRGK
jgi:uncharacterized protein (DUF305 family)